MAGLPAQAAFDQRIIGIAPLHAQGALDMSQRQSLAGDIGDHGDVLKLLGHNTHSVFHLAAIVSAGAEADFEGGYRVNFEGTKHVLEACRAMTHTPRVVFASSVAVYGGDDLPKAVTDQTAQRPTTSRRRHDPP